MLKQFLSAATLTAAIATAQSPLTSIYQGGNGLGTGSTIYFDLILSAPLTITQIDVNSSSPVNTSGTIDVRWCANSYVGNDTNAGAWTLVSSGSLVAQGGGIATPVTITPFALPPGNYGMAITFVGIGQNYTNGTGTTVPGTGSNQTYSNTELTLLAGASSGGAPGTAICCNPRVFNGALHYTVGAGGGTFASRTNFGTGCPAASSASSFYELFPNGTFDLSNSSLQLVPTGGGYIVLPGTNAWHTPTGATLPLMDDSVSAAQSLGFMLSYPGGSTNAIYVSSNGFVWAQPNIANGCCVGNAATLRTQGARWCPNWGDLNPVTGGSVQFDTDPMNGAAYVTFTNVPEFGQAQNTNTFQVAFFSTGVVEYRYQNCMQSNRVVLTGWSAGTNSSDPGSVDISASLPIITGFERRPLTLAASARPLVNSNVNLVTSNISASAPFGATILSFAQVNLDLTFLGMPGCFQYTGSEASLLFLPAGAATFTQPITVPNLTGLNLYCQSAVYDPAASLTPFGATSSNGVHLVVGTL